MTITKEKFDILAKIIKDGSGIVIGEGKEYLLEGRLLPVAKKYNLDNISDFIDYLQENKDESLLIEILEAMTTNESFFFRDIKVFDILTDEIIPKIKENFPEKSKIRIWSAACSTGQEPYSIIISALENPKCQNVNLEIIATDLDFNVLEKAKEGVYTQFEVQRGVPINLLLKYFAQDSGQWKIKEEIRNKVIFEKFNLLEDSSKYGTFDIILCRNVLIYFDVETKQNVLRNMCKRMDGNSTLILGSTESVIGIDTDLRPYKKDTAGIYNISGDNS